MQKSKDFHPSVWECNEALDAFLQAFQCRSIGNNMEIAIRCALAAVWESARRYQVQLEIAEMQRPIKPEVITLKAERKGGVCHD